MKVKGAIQLTDESVLVITGLTPEKFNECLISEGNHIYYLAFPLKAKGLGNRSFMSNAQFAVHMVCPEKENMGWYWHFSDGEWVREHLQENQGPGMNL